MKVMYTQEGGIVSSSGGSMKGKSLEEKRAELLRQARNYVTTMTVEVTRYQKLMMRKGHQNDSGKMMKLVKKMMVAQQKLDGAQQYLDSLLVQDGINKSKEQSDGVQEGDVREQRTSE